jgi:hypothetical protein
MATTSLLIPIIISVLAIILGTTLDRYVDSIISIYVPSAKAGLLWQTLYVVILATIIIVIAVKFLPKLDLDDTLNNEIVALETPVTSSKLERI